MGSYITWQTCLGSGGAGGGLEGGYRPKYIIRDCRFFLDLENGILLNKATIHPTVF